MNNVLELKDKHKGEDLWVITAGSSLDFVSKDFFDGKLTIGQNDIWKHFKCDYVVMKDCNEEPRFPRLLEQLNNVGIPVIYSKYYKGYRRNGLNNVPNKNSYYFDHNPRDKGFDTELMNLSDEEVIVSRSTVTSILHIGALMGVKNIILCGHDAGKIDGKLYFKDYVEKDWVSAGNWSGIEEWMGKLEDETIKVKQFLNFKYGVNIYSLNPFINFKLEGHKYEAS
jgi:hypothetical protein|tara:strand:+ start:732 stop:1406 length:675 start_codon:yes stop_codon:yes gene_type:complete